MTVVEIRRQLSAVLPPATIARLQIENGEPTISGHRGAFNLERTLRDAEGPVRFAEDPERYACALVKDMCGLYQWAQLCSPA